MRFKVTGSKEHIYSMKKDLDEEIENSKKMQGKRAFKMASKVVEKMIRMPLMLVILYKEKSPTELELTVGVTAEHYINKKAIESQVKKRAKSYGKEVTIELIKEQKAKR